MADGADFDPCPGFPAEPVPHRWVPIGLHPQSRTPDWTSTVEMQGIVVIEVCPSCLSWRALAYHRRPIVQPERPIVPRDPNGVHSTT